MLHRFQVIAPLLAICAACVRTAAPVQGTLDDWLAQGTWADVGRACTADASVVLAPVAASLPFASDPLPRNADLNVLSAWLARRLPGGWGGGVFFRRADGDPAMYLKRPAERDSLLAALSRIPEGQQYVGLVRNAEIITARWDFAELYDWSLWLGQHLSWTELAIIAWDINEAGNRLEISINEKRPQAVALLEARLRELNVPCFLVRYRLEPIEVLR